MTPLLTSEVRRCAVDEIFHHDSFAALEKEAAEECANPDLSAVMPDREMYRLLEMNGAAMCFRLGAGDELFGFALALVAPSAHNRQRYATVESLFIAKEHRSAQAWKQMLTALKDAAREAGCEALFCSAHVGSRFSRLLFLSADIFKLTNYTFCARLR